MTSIPSASEPVNPDELFRTTVPVLGVVAAAVPVGVSAIVRQLRGIATHPSRPVRVLLAASLIADGVIAGYGVGKANGQKIGESPEQTRRRVRQHAQRPIKLYRYVLPARESVAQALITGIKHGPRRAIFVGALNYAVSIGFLHFSRAIAPRMERAAELSEQLKEQQKRQRSGDLDAAIRRLEGLGVSSTDAMHSRHGSSYGKSNVLRDILGES